MLADDRFCGTDADQHEDISRNGSSGFGGNADSAEMADLAEAGCLKMAMAVQKIAIACSFNNQLRIGRPPRL